tara:strand:+ start:4511 stop:5374 length:864 start_codon:yes stop_codon:yes gene_type:complete
MNGYLKAKSDLVTTKDEELYNFIEKEKSFMILTYGETNSGKTYTIRKLMELMMINNLRFPLWISGVEIYNNEMYTLIPKRQKMVETRWMDVYTKDEFKAIYNSITRQRSKRSTIYNNASSRSHMIIIVKLKNKQYCFVDLAGNESRVDADSAFINISLLCLRQCILAIQSKNKRVMIPYRRSKLTYYLKDLLQYPIYCVCTIISSVPLSRNTRLTIDYGISMKGIMVKKENKVVGIKKYIEHTKKLSKMEEDMLKEYMETEDNKLLILIKELLKNKIEVSTLLLNTI